MTQARYYSSTAVATTLTGSLSSGATTFTVTSASGFPVSVPFTLILERDTALEEIVTVNTISGTNVTSATRGVDGTSAVGHSAGAKVEHGVSARDFNEPQVHIAATSAAHGVAGSLVGTTDAQTLTNKTLTSPTINTPTINTPTIVTPAVSSPTISGSATVTASGLAAGRVGGATLNAARGFGTIESAITGLDSIAFTAVAGRRYKVRVTLLSCGCSANCTANLKVRDGGGSAPTNTSTILHVTDLVTFLAAETRVIHYEFELTGLSAGAHTIGLFAITSSGVASPSVGSATASALSTLAVEDIGT